MESMALLLLFGVSLSQQLVVDKSDICVFGPAANKRGGLYEYKGLHNNKPYYQQRECERIYFNNPIGVSGGIFLFSFIENDGSQRYIFSDQLDVKNTDDQRTNIYCDTLNIDKPQNCLKWVTTDTILSQYTTDTLNIYDGECPDILDSDAISWSEQQGRPLQDWMRFVGFDVSNSGSTLIDGKYNIELGLNMFKKSELSSDNKPIYLYFDPYYFTWRFIHGFNYKDAAKDPYSTRDPTDQEWIGNDKEIFTCPIYSSDAIAQTLLPQAYEINGVQKDPTDKSWDGNAVFKHLNPDGEDFYPLLNIKGTGVKVVEFKPILDL